MNVGPLLLRRTTTSFVCRACRRSGGGRSDLVKWFSSSSPTPASFQAYTLPSQVPPTPQPRNAEVPETSMASPVAHSIETASAHLPRVHETRPPQSRENPDRQFVSEEEAQESKAEFVGQRSILADPASPSTSTAPTPSPTTAAAATTSPPKRSKLRTPRKAAMKLTPAAVEQLRALLDQPEPKLIKVGVRNRGCSGLAYHLEYVDRPGTFDETVEQDGVRVLIDSKALFSIIGSEMDWVADKLSQRFVFRNPNIKEECGCGESFMV